MQVVWWVLATLGALLGLVIAQTVYLAMVLRWEDERTVGLKYYGRTPAEQRAFKRQLRRHAFLLAPVLWLNGRLARLDFRKSRIQYKGISAPAGSCNSKSFARGESYEPRAEDIFVVTQMKCGTTWMQHVVYEVLHRGQGNLVESGTALYAVSPWLEARKSVPVDQAPLLGRERASRMIKTHFPVELCPFSRAARYIYVARHPVSCFASCIDFVQTNVGRMAPDLPAFEEWFCTPDLMWWGTWTTHVKGWWERAQHESNVLFVHFEEMKRNLPAVIVRVAEFLQMAPLSEEEIAHIAHKCGFAYMQQHQDRFEMHPPHILQTNAALFVSGAANRHQDLPADLNRRVLVWASRELSSVRPLMQAYPDLTGSQPRGGSTPSGVAG